MIIRKTTLYFIGIIILIILGGYFMIDNSSANGVSNAGDNLPGNNAGNALAGNGNVQKVVIGVRNYNYYPNTITVKVGQPVSISLDESVSGCLRDFTIRDFGIREYLRTPQDTIEFTPDKKGTFTFACSMGMGRGRLIVE